MVERELLGRTGLYISRLALGTATFGRSLPSGSPMKQIGETDVPEATEMVARCRDIGINYFDTSNVYSAGEAETILGKALGSRRQEVLIGTKATLPTGTGLNELGSSRHNLVRSCEASLRRLGTDWIDLYQLHYPDGLTPIEETMRALDELVRAGKVRYIGCSNFGAWQMMKAMAASQSQGLERFASHQISYSLVGREVENEIVPAAVDQGVSILAWGPLANGALSGKYRRGAPKPPGTRMEAMPESLHPDWNWVFGIIDVLDKIALDRGVSVAQVAINWQLRKPWVTSVLLGARSAQQLEENLAAADWALTAEETAMLDGASHRPAPYPQNVHRIIVGARNPPFPSYRP